MIAPPSPIKVWVNHMEKLGQLGRKLLPDLEHPMDLEPDFTLPTAPTLTTISEYEEVEEQEDIHRDLCQTRAAFLFDGSGATPETAIPPLVLPPIPQWTPSTMSLQRSIPFEADRRT